MIDIWGDVSHFCYGQRSQSTRCLWHINGSTQWENQSIKIVYLVIWFFFLNLIQCMWKLEELEHPWPPWLLLMELEELEELTTSKSQWLNAAILTGLVVIITWDEIPSIFKRILTFQASFRMCSILYWSLWNYSIIQLSSNKII